MTASEMLIAPSAFMALAGAYCIYISIHMPRESRRKGAFRIACSVILTVLWAIVLVFSLMNKYSDFVLHTIMVLSALDLIVSNWHDFWKHSRIARKARAKTMTFIQKAKHLRNKLAGDDKKAAKRAGIPDTD